MIQPGPSKTATIDASLVGQGGVLVGYYNAERWCNVALDGPGEEKDRLKSFNVDVVKEDPAYAAVNISEGVPPGAGAAAMDSYEEYAEAEAAEW